MSHTETRNGRAKLTATTISRHEMRFLTRDFFTKLQPRFPRVCVLRPTRGLARKFGPNNSSHSTCTTNYEIRHRYVGKNCSTRVRRPLVRRVPRAICERGLHSDTCVCVSFRVLAAYDQTRSRRNDSSVRQADL